MKKPNIIVIMSDDQGYGDLSCMGATDFVTPHLDSLASSGARFATLYANSPVCSPSRAALLTGRYPYKAGVRSILGGTRKTTGLTCETPTLAAALKEEGYHTGLVGKWHLGLAPQAHPCQNGFDSFFGFMAGCIDYYSHIFYWQTNVDGVNPIHDLWENEREVYCNGQYFTQLVTQKGVEFISEQGNKEEDSPFFLYVGYNAPHYPMHAPEEYMNRFAHLPWDRQVMAAMISCMDDGVGQLVAELKRQKLYDNTIIYFQSDNGPSREARNWLDGNPDAYYGGSAGAFKGHKYSLFEGGIRVPAILSWPAHIPAGLVVQEPCAAMDLFPTLLKAAGGHLDPYNLDGKDILPMLCDGQNSPHHRIFWEMGTQTAVRQGQYKLVINGQLEENQPPQPSPFLSNLLEDPGETKNLAEQLPELTQELEQAALAWRAEVEAYWQARTHSAVFP